MQSHYSSGVAAPIHQQIGAPPQPVAHTTLNTPASLLSPQPGQRKRIMIRSPPQAYQTPSFAGAQAQVKSP